MTREEVAGILQRRTDAINSHDVTALSALYSPDCMVESPMAAGTVQGRQAVIKVFQALFEAFPDVTFAPDLVVIDGNIVASAGWLSGTYTGGFMELPPSGKTVRVPAMTISTIEAGRIVAERRVYDFTGMLVQAGVLKAKPA
jgi:steroid delta-isomerase-like uncharacterized protein